MADWSQLPNDLVELIVGRLETSFQTVLFRSVSSSWRSVVPLPDNSRCLGIKTNIPFNAGFSFNGQPPFESEHKCTLKKISNYLVRFKTPFGDDYLLAEMRERKSGKRMIVSSPLSCNSITYESGIYEMLFNSLTSQIIPFGHRYEISYDEMRRIRYYCGIPSHLIGGVEWVKTSERVVFLELHCRDFVVLAGVGMANLVMYRSRNMSWTEIVDHPKRYESYQDMVAFKGKFYAVDSSGWGQVFAIKVSLEVTEIASVRGSHRSCKESLVKSGEELLLVQQFTPGWGHDEEMYTWFRVFRLDEERGKWVEVNDLNDRVIFLGYGTNICCSVQKLPGAKENCIVFIERHVMLMFDLRTRRISNAFSECRGYMGAFGANLESLVSCGVMTMPDPATSFYDTMID